MSGTLAHLLDSFSELRATREPLVLATIVATGGSSYRKAGARMLFTREGRAIGMLAGGDFERELFAHARELFEGGAARTVTMTSPGHGAEAAGRANTVTVLLQTLDAEGDYRPLSLIARTVERREKKVLVTVCRSTDPRVPAGSGYLAGEPAPNELPPGFLDEVSATAESVATSGESVLVDHLSEDGEVEVFYSIVTPPLSLLILGATPDAVPVAQLARLLGWKVDIADPRGDVSGPGVPLGQEVLRVPADALATAVNLDDTDAAVLLTRDFELDRGYLAALAGSSVPYIGLLGSRDRCARLLGAVGGEAGRSGSRVHGPIGLALGADTPEEIALSITAQVQAEYRKRAGTAAKDSAAHAALAGGVHAVLLAAGGSRRFDGFKQLLEFRGESLLRRAARTASELLEGRVVVVHGPKPTKCQRELAGIDVAHAINANWEGGVATSLRAGIRALPEDCAAALVLLCDQPFIGADQMRALLRAWAAAPERIAASAYADTLGVPAILPRQYFPQILQLGGDRGAKAVIEANAASVTAVAIPEAAMDIDTQDDYAAMLMQNEGPGR